MASSIGSSGSGTSNAQVTSSGSIEAVPNEGSGRTVTSGGTGTVTGTTGAASGAAVTHANVIQEQGQASPAASPSGWNSSVLVIGAVAIVGLLAAFIFFTRKD